MMRSFCSFLVNNSQADINHRASNKRLFLQTYKMSKAYNHWYHWSSFKELIGYWISTHVIGNRHFMLHVHVDWSTGDDWIIFKRNICQHKTQLNKKWQESLNYKLWCHISYLKVFPPWPWHVQLQYMYVCMHLK